MRRAGRAVGAAVALLIALAGTFAPAALAAPTRPTAPQQACTYPAVTNQVLVVIDFGDVEGVDGTRPAQRSTTVCVVIPPGSRGMTALMAALDQLGWTARFEGSMVCAIGGYPAEGCAVPSGENFLYWSYWHGQGGTWTYSGTGAAMSGAKCFQVEGWRFIDGAPQVGANEWPDGSALATGMCPPAAPATTVPPTAAPSPTTRGPGGGAGPKPQSPPSVPGTRPGDASAADSASSVGATTTTVAPDADTASGRPATTTTLDRSKVGAWADVQSPEQRREAVAIETSDGSSSAGKWLGAGAGAVVLGSVAAVGIAQARRRRPA